MKYSKYIYIIITIVIFSFILTACKLANNINKETEKEESIQSIDNNMKEYIQEIANIPNFEPCYKIVFAFEMLEGGVESVPLEKVKSMYNEIKNTFDYIIVSEQPVLYYGNYEREMNFVDGYDSYQDIEEKFDVSKLINIEITNENGKKVNATPLKTVMIGETITEHFDDDIAEGRNFQVSDFVLKSPNEPISVILGSEYKKIYNIGDIFSLDLIGKVMDFKVIGFYKPNTSFSMEVSAQHKVNFDYAIILPHLMFDYEATDKASVFQQAFITAEKTSGYVVIEEPFEKINDLLFEKYVNILEEIAEQNGLSGLYKYPYRPVGFVW